MRWSAQKDARTYYTETEVAGHEVAWFIRGGALNQYQASQNAMFFSYGVPNIHYFLMLPEGSACGKHFRAAGF